MRIEPGVMLSRLSGPTEERKFYFLVLGHERHFGWRVLCLNTRKFGYISDWGAYLYEQGPRDQ